MGKYSQYKPEVDRQGTQETTNKINIESIFAILNRHEQAMNSLTDYSSNHNIYLDGIWDLVLDADRDTWIDAPIDDQINININNALDFTFTINSFNVLAGSSVTIADMTAGSVIFAGAAGLLSQDNANLFWDNTTKRIGIKTAVPDYELDVAGSVGIDDYIRHNDDVDTYMYMLSDRIMYYVGGEWLLDLYEGVQDYVKLGDGGDVDINLNDMVFIEGSSGNVGINCTPAYILDILKNQNAATLVNIKNINNNVASYAGYRAEGYGNNNGYLLAASPSYTTPYWRDKVVLYSNNRSGIVIEQKDNYPIEFFNNASMTMQIGGTGAITFNAYGLGILHSSAAGLLTSSAVVNDDLGEIVTAGTIPKGAAIGLVDSVITESAGKIGVGMSPVADFDVDGNMEAGTHVAGINITSPFKFTNNIDTATFCIYGEGNTTQALGYFLSANEGMFVYTTSVNAAHHILAVGNILDAKLVTGASRQFIVMADGKSAFGTSVLATARLNIVGLAAVDAITEFSQSGTDSRTTTQIKGLYGASYSGYYFGTAGVAGFGFDYSGNPRIGNSAGYPGWIEINRTTGNISFSTDGVSLSFGVDSEVTLTHVHNVGLSLVGSLQVSTGFGCNSKTPQTAYTVDVASTDLATVVALTNQIRLALIANGICV